MQAGEIALFHFDGKARMLCDVNGDLDRASATRFGSQQEAETYAQQYVSEHPGRGCRLYDSDGDVVAEIRGKSVPSRQYTRAMAKRDFAIGIAGFVLIPVGFLLDRWVGWGIFLGMALATKFVLLAIMKLSEGLAGLMETKRR